MSNKNQKRLLKGAPASKGGEYTINPRAASGRELLKGDPIDTDDILRIAEEGGAESDILGGSWIDPRDVAIKMEESMDVLRNADEYDDDDIDEAAANIAIVVKGFRESQYPSMSAEEVIDELRRADRLESEGMMRENIEEMASDGMLSEDFYDRYFNYSEFGHDIRGDLTADLDEEDPDDASLIEHYEGLSDYDMGMEWVESSGEHPDGYINLDAVIRDEKMERTMVELNGVEYYYWG